MTPSSPSTGAVRPTPLRRLLAATDLTTQGHQAVVRAVSMARVVDGDVDVLHVAPPPRSRLELDLLTRQLNRELRRLRPRPAAMVALGDAAPEIRRAARQTHADCVVIGAHGAGSPARSLAGSTAGNVAQRADRSVLLVRRPVRARYQRVLVGVDGSQASLDAVSIAAAWCQGATVEVVTVATMPGRRKLMAQLTDPRSIDEANTGLEEVARDDLAQRLAAHQLHGLVDGVDAVVGHPAEQLLVQAQAHRSDLLVVGATGAGTLRRALVGSVARDVARHADCDVLVVRWLARVPGDEIHDVPTGRGPDG